MKLKSMQIIGLTGSIAAGKTSAAHICRQMGLPVHDSDKVVHKLLGPAGSAVPYILNKFPDVGDVEKGIDRQALGQIVFTDPEAKQWLEALLHPLVSDDRTRYIRQCRIWGFRRVILDIPLLFEVGADSLCDKIITVWAPDFLRQHRAMMRPGMTEEKYKHIVASQMPQAEKIRLSDLALPSGLGYAETRRRLQRFLNNRD